jgi:hypothetical protein
VSAKVLTRDEHHQDFGISPHFQLNDILDNLSIFIDNRIWKGFSAVKKSVNYREEALYRKENRRPPKGQRDEFSRRKVSVESYFLLLLHKTPSSRFN